MKEALETLAAVAGAGLLVLLFGWATARLYRYPEYDKDELEKAEKEIKIDVGVVYQGDPH